MVFELTCKECGKKFKYSTKELGCEKVPNKEIEYVCGYTWKCKRCGKPVCYSCFYPYTTNNSEHVPGFVVLK